MQCVRTERHSHQLHTFYSARHVSVGPPASWGNHRLESRRLSDTQTKALTRYRDLVFCILQVCKISNILRLHSHSSFPPSLLVRLIHMHGNLLYSCYQM